MFKDLIQNMFATKRERQMVAETIAIKLVYYFRELSIFLK